ncbi:MAG: hypothetical protein ACYTGS_16300, partial [Planctomycetota bacterium]
MKPTNNLEETIKKDLSFTAGANLHDRMLDDVLNAQEKSKKTKSAATEPKIRRIIMKSSITKLAAAVIIVVIGLGILAFIDTGSTSGVVWAEVARNVEASPGAIWRLRGTGSRDPNDDWPNGYTITWRSAAVTRTDRYRDGQIRRTIYYNVDT